jgi:hypothetical protein
MPFIADAGKGFAEGAGFAKHQYRLARRCRFFLF